MTENYPKIYLYKRIVQAKLFIDDHFAMKLETGNIADEAYFSKFHFIRLFRKVYAKTPHQYLTMVRIEKAKKFLQDNHPVAQVCFIVGFESVSSFTALFKRYAGLTPSGYLLKFKQRQEEIKNTPLKFIPNCFLEEKQ